MPRIRIANLKQIDRRANTPEDEDPRCIFYQAILESDTLEEYMNKVGDRIVVPPTHRVRMGALREFRYMRDDVHWVQELPDQPDVEIGNATQGFQPNPDMDARLRVLREIIQRQGQQHFRANLLRIYGNRCAVTGCAVDQLLEAAHVTPYLGTHTNELTNGLLLRADIHNLWDRGLLAARPDNRTTWVSPDVASRDSMYAALEGSPLREPTPIEFRPSDGALLSQWKFAMQE